MAAVALAVAFAVVAFAVVVLAMALAVMLAVVLAVALVPAARLRAAVDMLQFIAIQVTHDDLPFEFENQVDDDRRAPLRSLLYSATVADATGLGLAQATHRAAHPTPYRRC
jgi:MFS superfamily sulfate permease-like transporter